MYIGRIVKIYTTLKDGVFRYSQITADGGHAGKFDCYEKLPAVVRAEGIVGMPTPQSRYLSK